MRPLFLLLALQCIRVSLRYNDLVRCDTRITGSSGIRRSGIHRLRFGAHHLDLFDFVGLSTTRGSLGELSARGKRSLLILFHVPNPTDTRADEEKYDDDRGDCPASPSRSIYGFTRIRVTTRGFGCPGTFGSFVPVISWFFCSRRGSFILKSTNGTVGTIGVFWSRSFARRRARGSRAGGRARGCRAGGRARGSRAGGRARGSRTGGGTGRNGRDNTVATGTCTTSLCSRTQQQGWTCTRVVQQNVQSGQSGRNDQKVDELGST